MRKCANGKGALGCERSATNLTLTLCFQVVVAAPAVGAGFNFGNIASSNNGNNNHHPVIIFGEQPPASRPFSVERGNILRRETSNGGRLAILNDIIVRPATKNAMEAALYRYFAASVPFPDRYLEQAIDLMNRYKNAERLVLLELAIWKALCVLQMTSHVGSVDYYAMQQWMREGWKMCKAEQRHSNAASVIVPAVMQYLE
jgi:hypothetical protein